MSTEQHRSRGFVLVGVVWFLAVMTLLAAAAVLWVERSVNVMENRRAAMLREIEESTLLARVQWLIATQGYTIAGLTIPSDGVAQVPQLDSSVMPVGGELPLDGRPLCMANGWCLGLTDDAARLSLSAVDPRLLGNLLLGLGVTPEEVPAMLAQWSDYLMPEGAPRLGSAGGRATWRGGSQDSRRTPRSVLEVFLLDRWQPWEEHLLNADWTELVTTSATPLNINTADPRVLNLAWGLPVEQVSRLVAAREQQSLARSTDLRALLGAHANLVPDDGWTRLASSTLSIRLHPTGVERATEYEVSFSSDHRMLPPWQLQLKRSVKRNEADSIHASGDVPGILSAPLMAGPW
ncbi:type II secretion system protein GspK [Metapseudomonas resinovorans]|uniref:type II secretion system protein GspK n=1 Tax=Metapseudomonas resinovorans TaxID=53412 RepID=UPI00048D8203|nr:type II secretion system protein GspK [Pseudomonas resinovorans]